MPHEQKRALGRGFGMVFPETASPDAAFGHEVKVRRAQLRITQADLQSRLAALDLNLNTSTIARIESGARPVRLSEALLFAEALETTLGSLIDINESLPAKLERLESSLELNQEMFVHTASAVIEEIVNIRNLLRSWPALILDVGGVEDEDLTSPEKYLGWLERSLRHPSPSEPLDLTKSEHDNVRQILINLVDRALPPPNIVEE